MPSEQDYNQAHIVGLEDKLDDAFAGIRAWRDRKISNCEWGIEDEMLLRYLQQSEACEYLEQ